MYSLRKFRREQLQSYIMTNASSYMYMLCMIKYLRISSYINFSYMALQPLLSECPNIWGKSHFLFYQCVFIHIFAIYFPAFSAILPASSLLLLCQVSSLLLFWYSANLSLQLFCQPLLCCYSASLFSTLPATLSAGTLPTSSLLLLCQTPLCCYSTSLFSAEYSASLFSAATLSSLYSAAILIFCQPLSATILPTSAATLQASSLLCQPPYLLVLCQPLLCCYSASLFSAATLPASSLLLVCQSLLCCYSASLFSASSLQCYSHVLSARLPSFLLFCKELRLFCSCAIGYNEFDLFLENKKYRPFDGCKIEI